MSNKKDKQPTGRARSILGVVGAVCIGNLLLDLLHHLLETLDGAARHIQLGPPDRRTSSGTLVDDLQQELVLVACWWLVEAK